MAEGGTNRRPVVAWWLNGQISSRGGGKNPQCPAWNLMQCATNFIVKTYTISTRRVWLCLFITFMSCSPIALAVLSSSLPAFAAAAGQRELRFIRRARPLRPTDPPQSEPEKEWVAFRNAQHKTRREVRATTSVFALGFRTVQNSTDPLSAA